MQKISALENSLLTLFVELNALTYKNNMQLHIASTFSICELHTMSISSTLITLYHWEFMIVRVV